MEKFLNVASKQVFEFPPRKEWCSLMRRCLKQNQCQYFPIRYSCSECKVKGVGERLLRM